MSEQIGDPWSVTFSHEALELIADPQANNYVMGPSPHDRRKKVFYWFEMCDPVSSQTYNIGDIAMQNFLLPAYFEPPSPERAQISSAPTSKRSESPRKVTSATTTPRNKARRPPMPTRGGRPAA
jgi:hypothetical protein